MGDNCDANRRKSVIHRMTRLCSVHDYRERCIYQITLVLADRASRVLGRLATFIGPEGDFTPAELQKLIAESIPTSFGDTELRVETAAIFAVSILSALT